MEGLPELKTRISDPEHVIHTLTGRAWEECRLELIEDIIESSSNPQKLRQLQWRIDGIIARVSSMGAVIKLNTMMYDSYYQLVSELKKF